MSDEYDYELIDDGGVASPVTASKPVIADGRLRTLNRKMMGWVAVALLLATGVYLTVIKQTRDSMASAASLAPTPPPTIPDRQKLVLPTPSPMSTTPHVLQTVSPISRATVSAVAYVPPSQVTTQQAEPPTPSPEQVYAEEERLRILEARRAPTRVVLDNESAAFSQQALQDQMNLAQGAQLHGATLTSTALQNNGQGGDAHQQFIAQHDGPIGYVQTTSPYELTRGTVITARWLTALDSTLPGGVLKAMVTKTVYDSKTHSIPVLVPGTILTGEGDSHAQAGEARYLCIFDRIELPAPDSRKFNIGSNNADGAQGENGASVSTDTHAGREFGHAFLYTLLQAGVGLASRASTVVDVGGNIGQVVQPNGHAAPTFHQYVGEPVTIIVSQDLPLDAFKENP